MKFKKLLVHNFRNFQNIEINLDNKNVIFGMNDAGKTNLLFALRILLDRNIRKNGFEASDYYRSDTNSPIEIELTCDISDRNERNDQNELSVFAEDSNNLIAKMGGARSEADGDTVIIGLIAKFDEIELFGNPELTWGSTIDEMYEIPKIGERYILDNIFRVVYIDPLLNLDYVMKKNKSLIFNKNVKEETDQETEEKIKENINQMNQNISDLSSVQTIQKKLTKKYREYKKEPLEIELKSEVAVTGYWDNLQLYIKPKEDENYYPTSGDGRKKLLAYAINNIVSEEQSGDKIVVYLIEEPENSLHRSMQLALSRQLFEQHIYNYLFVTTHSADILYCMDNVQLIKIKKNQETIGQSYFYSVPAEYKINKKKLNKDLSNSMFYSRVLLVEGGSETCLFEKVFSVVCPEYELNDKYLIQVDGVDFMPYIRFYRELGIEWFVKTDNDVRDNPKEDLYDIMGLNRGLKLIDEPGIPAIKWQGTKDDLRQYLQVVYADKFKLLADEGIYISDKDLENDLYRVASESLDKLTGTKNAVKWLQRSKLYNMIEYVDTLQDSDCQDIYNGFPVLKEFIENE